MEKEYKLIEELIKNLEKNYEKKLKIKVKENEKITYILIEGLCCISDYNLKKYCDNYVIGGGKNYEIYIELMIFKNK